MIKVGRLNITKRSEAEPDVLKQGDTTSSVSLSLVTVTLLEVVSVIISVLLINWAIVPIYPQNRWPLILPALLMLILIIYSQAKRGETWIDLGFSRRYFITASRLLFLPVTLGCIVLLAVGYITNSIHRSTHLGTNLLVIPFWGVVQQYVLQGFLYRRILFLSSHFPSYQLIQSQQVWLAILLTAGLFAATHLPNLTLASLTLIAAIVWTWVYERAPNLWALGLSHGLLSLVLMHSLPLQFLHSMSVGYKHFLYQKF
jgi:membrane protease YdiL (CAAX protease family)